MPGAKPGEPQGPNKYPGPQTKAQAAALTQSCRYLGETFRDGETITYRGTAWRCSAGTWVKT